MQQELKGLGLMAAQEHWLGFQRDLLVQVVALGVFEAL